MSNAADKCFRENQNTHFMFNNVFEIVWKNIVRVRQATDGNVAIAHIWVFFENMSRKFKF